MFLPLFHPLSCVSRAVVQLENGLRVEVIFVTSVGSLCSRGASKWQVLRK